MLGTRDWSHLESMSVEDSFLDINTTIQESLDIVTPEKEVCKPTKFVIREEWTFKIMHKEEQII